MSIKSFIKKFFSINNFNQYPDALIVIDHLENITDWNIMSEQLFGFARREITGRNVALLFDSELEKVLESAKSGKNIVISAKNHQGETIFVEISCKYLKNRKDILISCRDVTKSQKVIEKFLVEYETAVKINNNKNRFICGLSNDLKTPLQSLIGFSQGLLDGVCGELSEKQVKYVSIITKNGNILLEIIDILLDLSALEAENYEFNFRVFGMNQIIINLAIFERTKQLMYIYKEEQVTISNILKNNGVIAFPTDTVWGIGCCVENKQAVEKIYNMKSREKNKPLILLSSSLEYLLPYVEEIPPIALHLAEEYLPGALTIVTKKSSLTPDYITSGFDTVGIRIPNHPIFCEMVEKVVIGKVLATTSANISGKGSVSKKEDVIEADYIVDEKGFPVIGQESTIISIDSNKNIKILRQGAVILCSHYYL